MLIYKILRNVKFSSLIHHDHKWSNGVASNQQLFDVFMYETASAKNIQLNLIRTVTVMWKLWIL